MGLDNSEGDFWIPPKGRGQVTPRTNHVIWGLELSVPPPTSHDGRGTRSLKQPRVNDLVDYDCVMKPLEKPRRTAFGSFLESFQSWEPEYFYVPLSQAPNSTEDRNSFVWDLILCISLSGCWFIYFIISFNKLVHVFPWVLRAALAKG